MYRSNNASSRVKHIHKFSSLKMGAVMFTFPFGAFYAWFSLDSYTRLSSAEKLVEKQQQLTKLIELEG